MKQLIAVRHAKSDWSEPDKADEHRQLKRRGMRDADHLGEKLRHLGIRPDLILTSPAVRARQTAEILTEGFGIDQSALSIVDALYQSSPEAYRAAAAEIPETVKTLIIVGHNPEISDFVSILAGRDIFLHTSTAVILDIDTLWRDLTAAEQFMVINTGS